MDTLSPKKRSYRMKLIRSKGTKPEAAVWQIVKSLSYKCRPHVKTLPGRPDFAFPKHQKVIFVHGCFWHSHGRCRSDGQPRTPKSRLAYWVGKLAANRNRDEAVLKNLKKMGWKYLVVWECQTKSKAKLAKLPNRIKKFMIGQH